MSHRKSTSTARSVAGPFLWILIVAGSFSSIEWIAEYQGTISSLSSPLFWEPSVF